MGLLGSFNDSSTPRENLNKFPWRPCQQLLRLPASGAARAADASRGPNPSEPLIHVPGILFFHVPGTFSGIPAIAPCWQR
jgi:hypothetical protein